MRADLDAPALGRRVARVHDEVEDHTLELCLVDLHRPKLLGERELELDAFLDHARSIGSRRSTTSFTSSTRAATPRRG